MGWPTREVALREMEHAAKAEAERLVGLHESVRVRRIREMFGYAELSLTTLMLRGSVPNRLAGAEINEDGDAI